ncbi:MAG: hypothetical protein CEN89_125 [Candidatus Berkelbacteria bacterium Licking1014_7]|uniref:Permease n=1 Tax=Candidatus Berkelbacteria bacterium Licking1014_7 TaxID=2017147 RepID=A0A554LKF6_9BACT|nr:MAG: hypothetical protein CEN89_125 [Candidatus Berkelbacteria bacterium Licking1014_7]
MKQEKIYFDVSWQTILKFAAVILGLWFIWLVRDIVALFFVVLVFVSAFSPVVDKWSRKMNRVLAISLLYLIFLVLLGLVGVVIIPPVVGQIQSLAQFLPTISQKVFPFFGVWENLVNISTESLGAIASQLQSLTTSIYNTTIGFFGALAAVFTLLILTFYLLLEEQGAKKLIKEHLPLANRDRIVNIAQKIGLKMGAWLRGQAFLGLTIGAISYIGLLIIGLPYALTLAVWAGITELIPYIGPILGAIPALVIGFAVSPLVGLIVLIFYIVIQQLESQFLVPKIMQKAVGLSPVVIILSLLIGGKLAGILGVIISVPVAAAISVLVKDWNRLLQK